MRIEAVVQSGSNIRDVGEPGLRVSAGTGHTSRVCTKYSMIEKFLRF